MTLTATPAALTADADTGNLWPEWPQWYRWQNKDTGRWWAARTSVPINPRLDVMLISADTYDELLTAVVYASAPSFRAA